MLSGGKSWRKIICTVCHTFGRFYPHLYTVWSLFHTKETSFVRKHGLPCKGRKTLGETLACECGNLNCRR